MRFGYNAIFLICIASFATSVQAADSKETIPNTALAVHRHRKRKAKKQPQGWTGLIDSFGERADIKISTLSARSRKTLPYCPRAFVAC